MAISLGQLNKDTFVLTTDENSAISALKFKTDSGAIVSISADNDKVIFKDNNGKSLSSATAAKAISADILAVTAGDESTPVYFDNGQIKTCTITTGENVYTDDDTLSSKVVDGKKTFFVLKDYAMSSDVSSKTELLDEFAKYWKLEVKGSSTKPVYFDAVGIKECNPISSASELSTEMKLSDYALSNDIPKDLTGFTDSTNKYALNSNVSSKTELLTEFAKYALTTDVSSKTELDTEFAKYQLTSTIDAKIKGTTVDKATTADKLNVTDAGSTVIPTYFKDGVPLACNPISSAAELSVEMKLSDYAKSNDVSSKTELTNEFQTLSAVRNTGRVKMTGELEGGVPFTFYVLSTDSI